MRSPWRGEFSLAASFWGLYVLGSIVAMIVAGTIVFVSRKLGLLGLGWAIGGGSILFWQVFSAVAVWNSARIKTRSPIWLDRLFAYGAMFVVLVFSARLLFGLINGGAVRLASLVTGSMDLNP
jgi:hypothetical protein